MSRNIEEDYKMTEEQARKEIPDIDSFCKWSCDCCQTNDWYCPTECDILLKARQLDFNRVVKCYARHRGDLEKVFRYIKATKITRARGGY